MNFTRTIFDSNQTEIARVNRTDGTLYLKPQIWDHLAEGEREYVLWHEKGHLILQTKDEFQANQYAIKNFVPAHTLSNPELKSRITVMASILAPGRENSQLSGFTNTTAAANPSVAVGVDPVSAIAGAIGSVFSALPLLGIGSGARTREQEAAAAAQGQIITAQADADAEKKKSYLIWGIVGAAFIVVFIVLYFTFKKR